MEIMINGGTPFFDKSLMKWITKEEVKNDEEEDGEIEEESNQSESYQTEDDLPF